MEKIFIILAFVISAAGAAFAGETIERFSINRSGDGFVRTDTATGATSMCTETAGQMVCRMAADDRQAYEADIAALEAKLDSLEKRVSMLENPSAATSKPQSPDDSDTEFQTSLNQMEQFFRRFMGIVKEFQRFGGDTAPAPDRT